MSNYRGLISILKEIMEIQICISNLIINLKVINSQKIQERVILTWLKMIIAIICNLITITANQIMYTLITAKINQRKINLSIISI